MSLGNCRSFFVHIVAPKHSTLQHFYAVPPACLVLHSFSCSDHRFLSSFCLRFCYCGRFCYSFYICKQNGYMKLLQPRRQRCPRLPSTSNRFQKRSSVESLGIWLCGELQSRALHYEIQFAFPARLVYSPAKEEVSN